MLSHFENLDLTACVVKCLYDLRCLTVNFNRAEGLCETCDSHFDPRGAYLHDKAWLNLGTPGKGKNIRTIYFDRGTKS